MDGGEWRDSPAPACVPCPQPQDGWLSPAWRVACPQGFHGCGSPLRGRTLAPLIGATQSVNTQQGQSGWEVAAANSSSARIHNCGYGGAGTRSAPACLAAAMLGLGPWCFLALGTLCPGGREYWEAAEGCTQGWVFCQGLGDGDHVPTPGQTPQLPLALGQEEGHRCQSTGGGMGLCMDAH